MPSIVSNLEPLENKLKTNNNPTYCKKFDKQIFCISFSPFEWSQDILCISFAQKICIAKVTFEDDIDFETIGEFSHDVHCYGVSLSPVTSLNALPKVLQFCTAGSDYQLRLFKSDLSESNTCQMLSGHDDYINDISFESESNCIASVSDDQTARIWDTNDSVCVTLFYLTSPGVSVCWHNDDNAKLMVCEKDGLIRFYNVQTQQPILSLENNSQVSFAHWSPADSQLVGALQNGELMLWDLTRPSRPAHSKVIHTDGGGYMKFSPLGNLVVTVNTLASCLKVTQLRNGHTKLNISTLQPTNASWHFRLPIVCIGDDRNLCFWKVDPQ